MQAIAITATGVHAPPDVVSNEELCGCFNTWVRKENERRAADGSAPSLEESSPDFVAKVSGIRRRHVQDRKGILDPERMCPSIPDRPDDQLAVQAELGLHAARIALARAGRSGGDVDLVVLGASSLQRPYPALAAEVQHALGARGLAFDLSAGCTSACIAIEVAGQAVRTGSARCALVVTPEVPTGYANFRDRDSHFILGDAAVAVVIEPLSRAAPGAYEILSSTGLSQFSSNVRNNGGFLNRCDPDRRLAADKLFYQQGRKVFKDIVQLVPKVITEHLGKSELTPAAVTRYWLHQANAPMNAAIMRRLLGRDAEEHEAPMVLGEYGNTAAAGALIALDHQGQDLEPGQIGVLCAFGAGYSVNSQLLRKT